jgi:hypothetical protein
MLLRIWNASRNTVTAADMEDSSHSPGRSRTTT